MQIDIDRVLFWMDAIRNSSDKSRTLESFWKGQIRSKLWLIENLITYVSPLSNNIVIHGGWNGVLASLLFQTNTAITKIVSVDIDPKCEEVATTVNKIEEIQGKFQAVTANMADYEYSFYPDIVINTSCEHVDQETYNVWLSKVPQKSLIVLQSNNYFELDEHIRCANSLIEFQEQSKIKVISAISLELPKYTRFMLIGYNNV